MIDRAANAFSLGSALQLRILLRPRHIFAVRAIVTVVGLVAAVIGTALAGAWGVALGFALTSPLLSLVWLFAARRARRLGREPAGTSTAMEHPEAETAHATVPPGDAAEAEPTGPLSHRPVSHRRPKRFTLRRDVRG
jgi:uncharacterized protein (DUF58 family)